MVTYGGDGKCTPISAAADHYTLLKLEKLKTILYLGFLLAFCQRANESLTRARNKDIFQSTIAEFPVPLFYVKTGRLGLIL